MLWLVSRPGCRLVCTGIEERGIEERGIERIKPVYNKQSPAVNSAGLYTSL